MTLTFDLIDQFTDRRNLGVVSSQPYTDGLPFSSSKQLVKIKSFRIHLLWNKRGYKIIVQGDGFYTFRYRDKPVWIIVGCTHDPCRITSWLELTVDGVLRSYDLYLPKTASSERPLVLLYHGHFGSSDVMTDVNGKKAPYKHWLELAGREDFLVAVPSG